MPINENKENDLVLNLPESGGVSFPQTPAHLLKRSQSAMMKPSGEENPSNLTYRDCDAPVKRASPSRRVQQGRPPLASKDNNRSTGFLPQLQKLQQQPSLKRNLSQSKKRNANVVDGQLLTNPRRLKKYGSVLGYNALPKMKSLVLKDVDKVGEQGEDENDDEDEDHILRLKLHNAIDRSDEEGEEVGGLFDKSGLLHLVRDSKKDEDDWEDREIEYGPQRHEPLPYIPEGHLSLAQEDYDKLKTFRSPYLIEDDYSDSDDDKQDGFLQLEEIGSAGDDENIERENLTVKQREMLPQYDTFEIQPSYCGEGLDASDLNDLLKD